MNNEEKILEMLGQIIAKLESHDQRFESIDQRFESIDQRFDSMEQAMAEMDKRLSGEIENVAYHVARIEIEHGKKLDSLLDGYLANTESIAELKSRLDRVEEKVEQLELDVNGLKMAR